MQSSAEFIQVKYSRFDFLQGGSYLGLRIDGLTTGGQYSIIDFAFVQKKLVLCREQPLIRLFRLKCHSYILLQSFETSCIDPLFSLMDTLYDLHRT